jgi:hypothetical protein
VSGRLAWVLSRLFHENSWQSDEKMIRVFFTARRRCAVEQQALGMSSAEQDAP